jgi:hypothetical protein
VEHEPVVAKAMDKIINKILAQALGLLGVKYRTSVSMDTDSCSAKLKRWRITNRRVATA